MFHLFLIDAPRWLDDPVRRSLPDARDRLRAVRAARALQRVAAHGRVMAESYEGLPMTWVAGADGIKKGWRIVLSEIEADIWTMRDVAEFSELLKLREVPPIVCVDMPIGLHEYAPPGGRECESPARKFLRPLRSASVFSAPGRQTLAP